LHFFHCGASISHGSINHVLFNEHNLFNNFYGFNMKKTLIALASIAAVGAASAQVSITGYMSAGYVVATAPGTGAANGGFAVDTSELYIKSSEDMGGGYKATAGMGLGGLERATQTTAMENIRSTAITLISRLRVPWDQSQSATRSPQTMPPVA
jgi:hypothetical protein